MQKQTLLLALGIAFAALLAKPAAAQVLFEDFKNVAALPSSGWVLKNNSDPAPSSGIGAWSQGDTRIFRDRTDTDNSYIGASFESVGDPVGTISNWLLTPAVGLANGETIRFYTRTTDGLAFPDRLQVRLSTSGLSANVGTTSESVGDFSTLLLTINPDLQTGAAGYPTAFTPYDITLSGLPRGVTRGRLGFRYYVTDAGTSGTNGNYAALDTLSISSVPEPSTLAFAGGGLLSGLLCMRRRISKSSV